MRKALLVAVLQICTWAQTVIQPPSAGAGSGSVTSVSFTGGLISVANPTTTPALTVAGTSGGVPCFNSASTWTTSSALTANNIVIGGGAGACVSSITPASGVLTFLQTPSSANLASAVTNETGSGLLVFATSPVFTTPDLGTPSALVATNISGIPSSAIPAVPLTSGTSVTLSQNNRYFVCTNTCTVTVPVPAAGVQYCVRNAVNVATVITLAAIGSSAMYENTASTAYGTAGTGTFISGGAVGDKVCIVGLDSTHYLTLSYSGTWTAS